LNFADRLIGKVRALGHPLCLGLDPHLAHFPDVFRHGAMAVDAPGTVDAVRGFLWTVLERAAGKVAVVKPQSAFYEALGWRGVRLLEETIAHSRDLGFLIILDAKRGDIGSTAEAYADAYLSDKVPAPVDAITINPYLGLDTLKPFADRCLAYGRGIFTLVKTSNPGSGDFQDITVDDGPFYWKVATALQPLEAMLAGEQTGWSSAGAVVGATYPDDAIKVRELLPRSLFLIPGYGSQGGSAGAAVTSFVPGPAGLEGGVVNSSRALLFPPSVRADSSAADWDTAFDNALDQAIGELATAVGNG
jgi:orotidine-5'-phosphate decarboxylase